MRSGLAVFRRPRLAAVATFAQLSAWAIQWLACYVLLAALGLDDQAGLGAADELQSTLDGPGVDGEEALDRYERAGADAWSARMRARLRALGVRRGPRGPRHRPADGWESLTATERAVSLLVAEGLTNGAVARRLYMSPHTVNTHLRHVFAKLGVSSRMELRAHDPKSAV